MDWSIRPARLEDVEALAELHVVAWDAAQPAGVASRSLDERLTRWRTWFSDSAPLPRDETLVAESRESIIGFASVRPAPDADLDSDVDGQLDALYMHPDAWGSGLANGLAEAALDELRRFGFRRAILWVLEENLRARAFYTKTGWEPDGGRQLAFSIGDRDVMEIRFSKDL